MFCAKQAVCRGTKTKCTLENVEMLPKFPLKCETQKCCYVNVLGELLSVVVVKVGQFACL